MPVACTSYATLLTVALLGAVWAARLPAQLSPVQPARSAKGSHSTTSTSSSSTTIGAHRDILVLYFLSIHDSLGTDNLRHFILEAILNDQRCHFLLLVPSDHLRTHSLPPIPYHARLLHYHPALDKWSAYVWALQQQSSNGTDPPLQGTNQHAHSGSKQLPPAFSFYFLIDSSVRGPFISPMLKGLIPWWHPFLSKLIPSTVQGTEPDDAPGVSGNSEADGSSTNGGNTNANHISMVGATISCEDNPELASDTRQEGAGEGSSSSPPHVQLRAAAMTAAAMQLLLAGGVLSSTTQAEASGHPQHLLGHGADAQSETADQTEQESGDGEQVHQQARITLPDPVELQASASVLAAGGTLDCLMLRYAGIDWRQQDNWACNARLAPDGEFAYDGIQLDPYEVVFVPVNELRLQQNHPAAVAAHKYDAWLHPSNASHRVLGNQFLDDTPRFKLPHILEKFTQTSRCFDFDFFLAGNDDVRQSVEQEGSTLEDVWEFFVYYGQFEPREFRFTCPMDYQQFAGFSLKLHQRLLAAERSKQSGQ